ncbi:MAG: hypothetical protein ACYTGN_01800 [Planctomycetota bacterium]|jgi:hypothetical protein
MRSVLIVLSLCCIASAQDREALDPNTPTGTRQKLIAEAVKTVEGAARFAEYLGDPAIDRTIKHQIVEELFHARQEIAHIEAIIVLMLGDDTKLAGQVAWLIGDAATEKSRALALLEPLGAIADGTHPKAEQAGMLEAAVLALSQIPQRRAVEMMVDVWARTTNDAVREACRLAVRDVLLADTPAQASEQLRHNAHLSYYRLRKLVTDDLRRRYESVRKHKLTVIRNANAKDSLADLAGSEVEERREIGKRLEQLGAKGEFAPLEKPAFVDGVYKALKAELAGGDAQTAASLLRTLRPFAADEKGPFTAAPAREELFAALRALAGRRETKEAAGVAVELLGAFGNQAATHLEPFAAVGNDDDVRVHAIDKLGALARQDTAMRHLVGTKLAKLLAEEQAQKVRVALLFSLMRAPVDAVRPQIAALLEAGKLSPRETEYCIDILRQLGAPEDPNDPTHPVVQLLKLTKSGADRTRMYAVRGLLGRKAEAAERAAIYAEVERLALDAKQPEDIRTGVVTAFGAHGDRSAYDVLTRLGKSAGLAAAATAAKLELAQRLASQPKERDDLRTAIRVLREGVEGIDSGGDPVKLAALGNAILAAGKARNMRAEGTRYYLAQLYRSQKDHTPQRFEQLLADAAAQADDDQAPPDVQFRICNEYTELLLKGKRDQQALSKAIDCLRKLAKLSAAEQPKAAAFMLKAAEIATDLEDRTQAEELLEKAKGLGAEDTLVAALRKRVDALPKKSS